MLTNARDIIHSRACVAFIVAFFTLLNILTTLHGLRLFRLSSVELIVVWVVHVYSIARAPSVYNNLNEWPVSGLRTVALTPEESVHYRIETDVGAAEWETSLPRGSGVVFHPPASSAKASLIPYRLAFFHQLSCLSTLRRALANPVTPPTSETHFCLNYMRESLMCGADDHLEMVRSEYGGRAVLPYTTRTDCSDWERVWEAVEDNFDAWARRN